MDDDGRKWTFEGLAREKDDAYRIAVDAEKRGGIDARVTPLEDGFLIETAPRRKRASLS